jgi:hypothetical protein
MPKPRTAAVVIFYFRISFFVFFVPSFHPVPEPIAASYVIPTIIFSTLLSPKHLHGREPNYAQTMPVSLSFDLILPDST